MAHNDSQHPVYYLSGRQNKELGNGKVLRIAMPYPDDGIPGAHIHHDGTGEGPEAKLIDWAQRHLIIDATREVDIVQADVLTIPVNPKVRGAGGLGAALGQIYTGVGEGMLLVRILCVAVTIAGRTGLRGDYPTQWPARAKLANGTIVPAE